MRRSGEIPGPRGGVAVIASAADSPLHHTAQMAIRVAEGALTSTLLSVGITAILGNAHTRFSLHLVFLMVAGAIGIVLGATGYDLGRIDAGFLFAFFLLEPIGPVLLGHQTAPAGLAPALLVGLAAACWFMHKSSLSREPELPARSAAPDAARSQECGLAAAAENGQGIVTGE